MNLASPKTRAAVAGWLIILSTLGLVACGEREGAASAPAQPAGHAPGTQVEGLPAPQPADATLDGLFMIVRFSGGSITQLYYFFTPAGYAYLGIPVGGLEQFDFAAPAQANPERVGTYTIKGEKVLITLANGQTRELR